MNNKQEKGTDSASLAERLRTIGELNRVTEHLNLTAERFCDNAKHMSRILMVDAKDIRIPSMKDKP